jgi:hypothetical protein
MVAETGTGACDVGHGLLSSLGGGGGPVAASASAATSTAAGTAPATVVAGPVTASDGSHHRKLLLHNGGKVAASTEIVRPERVGACGQLRQGRNAVLRQHNAQLAREALQKEVPQKLTVLFIRRRQLQHAGEHLRGALAAQALRRVQLLETVILGEGVGSEEASP